MIRVSLFLFLISVCCQFSVAHVTEFTGHAVSVGNKPYNFEDASQSHVNKGDGKHWHSYTWTDGYGTDRSYRALAGNPSSSTNPTNNPTNNPTPTTTTPTTTTPTTTAEDSGTPTDTSSSQPVGPVATGTPQSTAPQSTSTMQRLRVTEYMVRDWSVGIGDLPQWIELYNPNAEAINLKGWTFQYATPEFRNRPIKTHTLTLAATEDGFSIAGGGVALLSTQSFSVWKPWGFSGIQDAQVYTLNIENVLKWGWVLTDADGREIHRIGRETFSALTDPVAPLHQARARVSHQVYPSEAPSEAYYYGKSEDIGSPGFYEEPAPAAPSVVRRKRVGTWASLKRVQEKF